MLGAVGPLRSLALVAVRVGAQLIEFMWRGRFTSARVCVCLCVCALAVALIYYVDESALRYVCVAINTI